MDNEMYIIMGYERQGDVLEMFNEYAASLLEHGDDVKECLQSQHYDEEVADLQAKYGLPDGRLYLAVIDDRPAGCGALTNSGGGFCELKRLYVRPGYRGRKIGRKLMEQLIDDAGRIGFRHIRLDTFPFMDTAIKMYEKAGFYRIEKYNDNPSEAAIFMQKDL